MHNNNPLARRAQLEQLRSGDEHRSSTLRIGFASKRSPPALSKLGRDERLPVRSPQGVKVVCGYTLSAIRTTTDNVKFEDLFAALPDYGRRFTTRFLK